MEKSISLTYDETTALIDMSVCSYAKTDEDAGTGALTKLGRLYQEFSEDEKPSGKPRLKEMRRAA